MKLAFAVLVALSIPACGDDIPARDASPDVEVVQSALCGAAQLFTYPPSNVQVGWAPSSGGSMSWYHGPPQGAWQQSPGSVAPSSGVATRFRANNGCCTGWFETVDQGGNFLSCAYPMNMTLYSGTGVPGGIAQNPGGRTGCQYYLKQSSAAVCTFTGGNTFLSWVIPGNSTVIYQRTDGTWNQWQFVSEGKVSPAGEVWIAQAGGQLH